MTARELQGGHYSPSENARTLSGWMSSTYGLYATGNLEDGTHTALYVNHYGNFKVVVGSNPPYFTPSTIDAPVVFEGKVLEFYGYIPVNNPPVAEKESK